LHVILVQRGRASVRVPVRPRRQLAGRPDRLRARPEGFGTENCVLQVADRPPQKRCLHMTRKEIDGFRKGFLSLAATLDRGLAHDRRELLREEEPDVPGGQLPSTEDRVDSGVQEVQVGLIANKEGLHAEVNAALTRIDIGTFGQCATCGKAIAQARLDALPYVRQCIRCARAV
jgi:RNA polymerase-binding transcription factor DksA